MREGVTALPPILPWTAKAQAQDQESLQLPGAQSQMLKGCERQLQTPVTSSSVQSYWIQTVPDPYSAKSLSWSASQVTSQMLSTSISGVSRDLLSLHLCYFFHNFLHPGS